MAKHAERIEEGRGLTWRVAGLLQSADMHRGRVVLSKSLGSYRVTLGQLGMSLVPLARR
jgi:hypothetical protein